MNILLLNGTLYRKGFEQLGHKVLAYTAQQTAAEHIGFSIPAILSHTGFEPDLVVLELFGCRPFPGGVTNCPYPLAAYTFDSSFNHFWLRHYLKLMDRVFVDFKDSLPRLAEEGIDAHWLPYAIDPQDYPLPSGEKEYDIGFVGVVEGRPRREALLRTLQEHFTVKVAGGTDKATRLTHRQAADIYARSRLVVNEYLFTGVNFRVFEAMAAGTLLLTEVTDNGLTDLFKPGVHLDTYTHPTLLAKIRYYLQQPELAGLFAERGRREVLAKHTHKHRAEEILDKCADSIGNRLKRDVGKRRRFESQAYFYFSQRWPDSARNLSDRIFKNIDFLTNGGAASGSEEVDLKQDEYYWISTLSQALWSDRATELESTFQTILDQNPGNWRFAIHFARYLQLVVKQKEEVSDSVVKRVRDLYQAGIDWCEEAAPEYRERCLAALKHFGPDSAHFFLELGRLYRSAGHDYEPNYHTSKPRSFPFTAVEWFQVAYAAGAEQDAAIELGLSNTAHGNAVHAIEALLVAIEKGPIAPELVFLAGEQSLMVFRRAEGLAMIEKAIQAKPDLKSWVDKVDLAPEEKSRLKRCE